MSNATQTAERQATTKTTQTVLNIGRTQYSVEKMDSTSRYAGYILRGPRGAVYGLLRNHNTPHIMHAINSRGGYTTALRGMWFSDASGSIEVAG